MSDRVLFLSSAKRNCKLPHFWYFAIADILFSAADLDDILSAAEAVDRLISDSKSNVLVIDRSLCKGIVNF